MATQTVWNDEMKNIRRRTKRQIALTAYHEAGHAVVADALDYNVDKVELYNPPLQDGRKGECFRDTRSDDEDEALMSLAGIISEGSYLRRTRFYSSMIINDPRFSTDDIDELISAFNHIHDIDEAEGVSLTWEPVFDSFVRYVSYRVKVQYLEPNWNKVQRIAQTLIEEGSICGVHLQEILDGEE